MNKLEKWERDDLITIIISGKVLEESRKGGNRQRSQKAVGGVFTIPTSPNNEEIDILRKIEKILFPDGAKNINEKNDVDIVFDAWKYPAILITADGDSKRQACGILGNKQKLKNILDIDVMTDKEAVELVETKIKKRDERYRRIELETGQKLPSWVGKD